MIDTEPPPFHSPRKAVALRWDRQRAPQITATGTGLTAEQIIQIAEEHGVPLRADPALTEVLAQIPLGDEIPPALYVVVAEVLAFIFTLAGINPYEPPPP